jgi:hypothetical protein
MAANRTFGPRLILDAKAPQHSLRKARPVWTFNAIFYPKILTLPEMGEVFSAVLFSA